MSTGAEFAGHRPHGDDARPDERFVRILFVEHFAPLADEIHQTLGRAERASFEIVRQSCVVEAAAQICGEEFDLLLLDPELPTIARSAAIELATELAHRLPVVVLVGTEHLDAEDGLDVRKRLRRGIEHADVAGKLLSAIRRSRRLGTGVMAPVFCRLEMLESSPAV